MMNLKLRNFLDFEKNPSFFSGEIPSFLDTVKNRALDPIKHLDPFVKRKKNRPFVCSSALQPGEIGKKPFGVKYYTITTNPNLFS